MTAIVPPRLEVVADRHGIHAGLLGRNRDLDEFTWVELFGRCLEAEFELLRHLLVLHSGPAAAQVCPHTGQTPERALAHQRTGDRRGLSPGSHRRACG